MRLFSQFNYPEWLLKGAPISVDAGNLKGWGGNHWCGERLGGGGVEACHEVPVAVQGGAYRGVPKTGLDHFWVLAGGDQPCRMEFAEGPPVFSTRDLDVTSLDHSIIGSGRGPPPTPGAGVGGDL